MSLNPPWNRILKEDNVTLICYENNSLEVDSAVWTHNNISLEETSSRLNIVKAQIQDSGEYRCQNNGSTPSELSEPVYLRVFAGKFQDYRKIDPPMWGMAHPKMGRDQVIPGLAHQGGTLVSQSRPARRSPSTLTPAQPCLLSMFCISHLPVLSLYSTLSLFCLGQMCMICTNGRLDMWMLQRAEHLK